MKAMLFFLALAVACGGQTIGDTDSGTGTDSGPKLDGGHCTTNADCGPDGVCGFAESSGCSALGQCFPGGPVCNLFSPGCACSGDTINIACTGLPNGYATAPLAHPGACSTSIDAGGGTFPCGTVSSCVEGQDICYIPANVPDGGTCMPSGGCTDCACAQAHFQCLSTCKQSGLAIYVQCQ